MQFDLLPAEVDDLHLKVDNDRLEELRVEGVRDETLDEAGLSHAAVAHHQQLVQVVVTDQAVAEGWN